MTLLPSSVSARSKAALASAVTTPLAAATCASPKSASQIERVVARAGMDPAGHDGKALLHILDGFPRDELFQIDADALYDTAIGVLNLQERQRIALFVRPDPLRALCLLPRLRAARPLRHAPGEASRHPRRRVRRHGLGLLLHLDNSLLARVHYIIRTRRGAVPVVDVAALERRSSRPGAAGSTGSRRPPRGSGETTPRIRLRMIAPFPPGYRRARRRSRRSPISTGSAPSSPARRSRLRCTRAPMTAPAAATGSGSTAATTRSCSRTCCRFWKTSV